MGHADTSQCILLLSFRGWQIDKCLSGGPRQGKLLGAGGYLSVFLDEASHHRRSCWFEGLGHCLPYKGSVGRVASVV